MEEGSRAIEAFVAFECSAALAFTITTVSASMLEGSTIAIVLCFVTERKAFTVSSSTDYLRATGSHLHHNSSSIHTF